MYVITAQLEGDLDVVGIYTTLELALEGVHTHASFVCDDPLPDHVKWVQVDTYSWHMDYGTAEEGAAYSAWWRSPDQTLLVE